MTNLLLLFEGSTSTCTSGMSSPDSLLQLHNAYATSPTKLHVIGAIASSPRMRRSGERKPPARGNGSFSPKQWKQWMREAQELNVSSSVFLEITSRETLAQAANDGLQFIRNPVVARVHEKLATLMDERANALADSTINVFTMKLPPAANTTQQWGSRPRKPRKRKKSVSLRIEPLLSDEVSVP